MEMKGFEMGSIGYLVLIKPVINFSEPGGFVGRNGCIGFALSMLARPEIAPFGI